MESYSGSGMRFKCLSARSSNIRLTRLAVIREWTESVLYIYIYIYCYYSPFMTIWRESPSGEVASPLPQPYDDQGSCIATVLVKTGWRHLNSRLRFAVRALVIQRWFVTAGVLFIDRCVFIDSSSMNWLTQLKDCAWSVATALQCRVSTNQVRHPVRRTYCIVSSSNRTTMVNRVKESHELLAKSLRHDWISTEYRSNIDRRGATIVLNDVPPIDQ